MQREFISLRLRCATLLLTLLATPTSAWSADPIDRHGADATFEAELTALAAKCDELGLTDQAEVSRTWYVPRDPRRHYLFLPSNTDAAKPARTAPQLVKFWYDKFRQVRREQAERLFDLACGEIRSGDEAAAYRLLHEVLHEDPDHAEARRVLGYAQGERGWRHESRRPSRKRNRGPHPQFGWPSNQYWQIESEHFELTTNFSARTGNEVVAYLERVYAAWHQLFYPYWSVAGRLAARVDGKDVALGPDQVFSVVLFRDREEYVRQLTRAVPQIGMSVGYYSQDQKTAFFYAGEDADRAAWAHESTHQFFQESGVVAPQVGERGNVWMVEGVALYMESYIDHDLYVTTGGADADRLQYARYRKLSQGYYVPLSQLVRYDRQQLQEDPNIRQIYSQSAGLTHYLIHGEHGCWMHPFIDYMIAVYRGAGQPQTLASEIGESYEQLDQGYHKFLNVTDADLAFVDAGIKALCLAHTQVTDSGLEKLPVCPQLRWLDLTQTAASDEGVKCFRESRQLNQLTLEGTRITDGALETVARFGDLEELDLSRTAVTDDGLKQLSRLSKLRTLFLTGTTVTDEGLAALDSLRNLQQLDVQGTKVTSAGMEQLRKRLPQLK